MRKQPAAAAVMAAAAITLAAALTAAQAAPEPATTETQTTTTVTAAGWRYYGAYSTLSRCYSVGSSHNWDTFACVEDYREGRRVYEL